MIDLTRRQFHRLALGSAATLALPSVSNAQTGEILHAKEGTAQLAPSQYPETQIWGYNGTVPGPVIRANQGARIDRLFKNDLPQASSVHWHGIRIENAMDGVSGITQAAVAPGGDFRYGFTLPDAGTYWYHPHNRSFEQMARGLYGALIVDEDTEAPEVDRDEIMLIDDWRLNGRAQIDPDFENMHDWGHGGRLGNVATVNGERKYTLEVSHNARLRLRLINTANARIFEIIARGLDGWVVALDGMPLETPQALSKTVLAPAQRADLIVDITAANGEKASLISDDGASRYTLATFDVKRTERAKRLGMPKALPANPVSSIKDLTAAHQADLLIQGGAMGSGMMMTMLRQLISRGKVWTFNGRAELGEKPLIEVERNETIRIAMTNDTAWPHGMHLHGHHFRHVKANGTMGPLRDTILMNPKERVEIAFVADNPGDWLLHCHMLEHSEAGMITWLRVT